MKKLVNYLAMPFLAGALALTGCSNKETIESLDIAGNNYSIGENSIIQNTSSFLEDGIIKFGVVSDIEGAIGNAKISADKLKNQNVDAVIIAGDCYENEKIRRNPTYPNSTDNVSEMIEGLRPYAEIGVPVFVISGNHETKKVYNTAISKLQKSYPNVLDINGKNADLQGLNLVGVGGYHHPRFTTQGGFLLNEKDYEVAKKSLENFEEQAENTLLISHGPPKSKTKIDYVMGAGHVGDENLKRIMNSNLEKITNVHGHIHEGGGNSDTYRAGNSINVASITSYNNSRGANTGLIEIKDNEINYKELNE